MASSHPPLLSAHLHVDVSSGSFKGPGLPAPLRSGRNQALYSGVTIPICLSSPERNCQLHRPFEVGFPFVSRAVQPRFSVDAFASVYFFFLRSSNA